MRALRRLTLLAIAIGVFLWLRKALSEEVVERLAEPGERAESAEPSRASEPDVPGSSNGAEPTKAELYERAKELDIEGRSKMSKQELQRAIRDAR